MPYPGASPVIPASRLEEERLRRLRAEAERGVIPGGGPPMPRVAPIPRATDPVVAEGGTDAGAGTERAPPFPKLGPKIKGFQDRIPAGVRDYGADVAGGIQNIAHNRSGFGAFATGFGGAVTSGVSRRERVAELEREAERLAYDRRVAEEDRDYGRGRDAMGDEERRDERDYGRNQDAINRGDRLDARDYDRGWAEEGRTHERGREGVEDDRYTDNTDYGRGQDAANRSERLGDREFERARFNAADIRQQGLDVQNLSDRNRSLNFEDQDRAQDAIDRQTGAAEHAREIGVATEQKTYDRDRDWLDRGERAQKSVDEGVQEFNKAELQILENKYGNNSDLIPAEELRDLKTRTDAEYDRLAERYNLDQYEPTGSDEPPEGEGVVPASVEDDGPVTGSGSVGSPFKAEGGQPLSDAQRDRLPVGAVYFGIGPDNQTQLLRRLPDED